jgi:hypothetical protein
MFGIGLTELFIMLMMAIFYCVPIATLILVILIYRNTRR